MIKKIFFLLLNLSIANCAYAVDPFLSDSEEDGTYAEEIVRTKEQALQSDRVTGARAELPNAGENIKENNEFRGTFDMLLNKAKPAAEEEKEAWTEFEAVEGTDAEAKFLQSDEYRINSELSKPIEQKNSFSSNLENIEDRLGVVEAPTKQPSEIKTDNFFGNSQ